MDKKVVMEFGIYKDDIDITVSGVDDVYDCAGFRELVDNLMAIRNQIKDTE